MSYLSSTYEFLANSIMSRGVVFHPKNEWIVSCGGQETPRVRDLTKRTAINRFWVLASHPQLELNLSAALSMRKFSFLLHYKHSLLCTLDNGTA